jgi:2-polyprenyl-6-methoxyphenol hydroxylase-like FAD-dependent oxidoreductase
VDDVVIVGAGPTGLTLACELSRRGRSCRLVESAPEPSETSKATVVSPRTLEVLDLIQVADGAVRRGHPIDAVCCYSGGVLLTRLRPDPGVATRFPFPLVLPQRETERLLLARLAQLGGHPERGRRVVSVRQHRDGVVATVEGSAGTEELHSRWLVGCDGAHSVVRHEAGIGFAGDRYPQTFVLAEVRADTELPADQGHFFLSPHGVVVFVALPGGTCRLTVDMPGPLTGDPGVEWLQRGLDRRGVSAVRVRTVDWVSPYRITNRVATAYRRGRVLIAGDAAHLHSPVGGQGMNTGIQDAVNLGWKLDLVAGGAAADALLDTYEAERLPVARAVVRGTDVVSRLGLVRAPGADRARVFAIRALARTGLVRRLAARATQLDVAYPRSAIVARPRAAGLVRPGRRAPDGALVAASGNCVRVHELFRHGGHTLLVFATEPDRTGPVLALASARGVSAQLLGRLPGAGAGALADLEGAVHRSYGVRGDALVLVRPDGHVAAAVPEAGVRAAHGALASLPRTPRAEAAG